MAEKEKTKCIINKDFYFEMDDLNYFLYKSRPELKEDEFIGYFGRLEPMFRKIVNITAKDRAMQKELITFKEFYELYRDLWAEMKQTFEVVTVGNAKQVNNILRESRR